MTHEEKETFFNQLSELEEQHPAFSESVRDNAYCEAIADVKRIIERINEPSLPSSLDEAAEEALDEDFGANWYIDERDDGCTEPGYNQKQMLLMFKSGAEWMAKQGLTVDGTFHHSSGYPSVIELKTFLRDYEGADVIVNIRKEQ